jgi:hypothetical protein
MAVVLLSGQRSQLMHNEPQEAIQASQLLQQHF